MFEEIPSNLHLEAREVISEIISLMKENITKDADHKNNYRLMSMWIMCYRLQILEVELSKRVAQDSKVLYSGMLIRRRLSTLLCLSQTRNNLNKTRKYLHKAKKYLNKTRQLLKKTKKNMTKSQTGAHLNWLRVNTLQASSLNVILIDT